MNTITTSIFTNITRRKPKDVHNVDKPTRRTMHQPLGLLSKVMTTPEVTVVTHVAIDFTRLIKVNKGSTHKPVYHKSYICIFICLKTRAVHMEICRTKEAKELLIKFCKFCNLQGTPKEIYSDNRVNFIGVSNELKDIQRMLNSAQPKIYRHDV